MITFFKNHDSSDNVCSLYSHGRISMNKAVFEKFGFDTESFFKLGYEEDVLILEKTSENLENFLVVKFSLYNTKGNGNFGFYLPKFVMKILNIPQMGSKLYSKYKITRSPDGKYKFTKWKIED